jgi:hypothetical protein
MEEKNRKYVLIRCQGSSLVKVNLFLAFFIRFSRRMNMSTAIEKKKREKEKKRRKTRKDNGKIRTYDRLW